MRFPLTLSLLLFTSGTALGQLPEQLVLDFGAADAYDPDDWAFVSPTPLGVTRPDPGSAVGTSNGSWNWSIPDQNQVLVGVYPGLTLSDSSIETTFSFVGGEGTGVGLINRFGAIPDPNDPDGTPLAHGYCVLTSPETVTLIDFDFARDPDKYVLPLAQASTPPELLTSGSTTARFQVSNGLSAADPTRVVPQFDFWLGDAHIFERVPDVNASWSEGWVGVDAWTVDPFAEKAASPLSVEFTSLAVHGLLSTETNELSAIVAPQGFETTEAPSSVGAGAPSQFRFQWQYDSQWFPQEEIEITELAFRRNRSTENSEVVFSDLEVAVSTQDANLQARFRDNIGEDEQLVFSGDLIQGLPVEEDPRPFDIVVPFDESFRYDPAQGDLLVDFRANGGVSDAPFWDAAPINGAHAKFAFSTSENATSFAADVLPVVQFTYMSVPSALSQDCNQDGMVNITDANCTEIERLSEFLASIDSLIGDVNADGTVDMADFLTLSNHFGGAGSYTDGDMNLSGVIDFSDFLILAANFGKSSSQVPASVPEPAANVMNLSMVVLIIIGRRSYQRRRRWISCTAANHGTSC